ncbi:MAG: TonB family protein [Pseudomonadota bacterium]
MSKKPVLPDNTLSAKAPAPKAGPVEPENGLDEALRKLRDRVAREAAVNAAVSRVRRKLNNIDMAADDATPGRVEGDNVSLSLRLYYQEVWDRVHRNWALPASHAGRLEAVVAVRIARDGSVEQVQLENRSGNDQFDRSALNAVRAANPLAPLPGDYLGRWHEMGIRFRQ